MEKVKQRKNLPGGHQQRNTHTYQSGDDTSVASHIDHSFVGGCGHKALVEVYAESRSYGVDVRRNGKRPTEFIRFAELLEEEAEVLSSFLEYCTVKYSKLSLEDFTKKINYLVKYKGYSNFNIQKMVNN